MISEERMAEYAKEAAVQMNAMLPSPDSCSHTYSPKFCRRVDALAARRRRRIIYAVKAAAACLLLMALLGTESTVLVSPAVRGETVHMVSALLGI